MDRSFAGTVASPVEEAERLLGASVERRRHFGTEAENLPFFDDKDDIDDIDDEVFLVERARPRRWPTDRGLWALVAALGKARTGRGDDD